MVRVWLRPALAAVRRQTAYGNTTQRVVLQTGVQNVRALQCLERELHGVRCFSSKNNKDKVLKKKTLSDKFKAAEDEDITEVPAEVQFLSQELDETTDDELDPELLDALENARLEDGSGDGDEDDNDEFRQLEELLSSDSDVDEFEGSDGDDDDDDDDELSDAEWASKYEKDLANLDLEDVDEVEDDRLYIEMPGYDSSLSMGGEGEVGEGGENTGADPFADWKQGMAYSPEMLNWMAPRQQRSPMGRRAEKPWKYFVRANHPDVVELALDVELLRLFISPTGRIRPRRFTGLTAKQQRQLARAVKVSRQMALLPFLSRYPEPTPDQWRAMEEEEIAKLTAQAENDEGNDDDDDDDDFDDMDEE